MTSSRKITANRLNAARSTGPRTKTGKSCSRGNARRHGFAAKLSLDPGVSAQVRALADLILAQSAGVYSPTQACVLAETTVTLGRVRQARSVLLQPDNRANGPATKNAGDSDRLLDELEKLARYERIALSRRRQAIAQAL